MKKNKALFALLAGVVAAALFVVPATAMAETVDDDGMVHLTQADFNPDYEGTFYRICDNRTYVLDEDVKGRIMFTSDGYVNPTLDLNGHELTGVGDSAILCSTGNDGQVTIKNGTLSQSNEKHVVYVDAGVLEVNLENVNVSATNAICVQVQSSEAVNINGGTYTTTNTKEGVDEPVLCAGGIWGRINVTSGDLKLVGGTTIVKRDNDASTNYIKIAPGASSSITFSSFPSQATIADGYSLLKTKGGSYEVVASGSDKVKNAYWKVTDVANFGTVYFEDGDEAKAFADDDTTRTATQLRATVTFDPANGVDKPVSYSVKIGGYASELIDNPGKADGVFKYWSADKETEFVLVTTPITADITLTALYDDAVATNGKMGYESLQDAINDNNQGAVTITLLKDTTERVTIGEGEDEEGEPADVNLTIDLGGKTLTSKAAGDAITLAAKGTLTIKNGTIRADDDCLFVAQAAAGSTVNLEGEDGLYLFKNKSSIEESGCVYVVGTEKAPTTVNVMGGNYESAGTYAVRVEHANLNVTDGQFSNGQDADDSSTILASFGSHVEFAGERVSNHIYLEKMSTANVHSGKFGDATNAGDVVAGKYLFKGDEDYYEVVDLDDALDWSSCVAYDYTAGTKVYFWKFEEAQAYAKPLLADGHDVAIVKLYTVAFYAWNGESLEPYDERTCEDGQEVGELPDSSKIRMDGYTFAGWYVDGQKIDSSYKVTKDVSAVAMWYKDGSEADPTDTPGDDQPSDSEDKKLPQTGDTTMAVSAVAAAGAALTALGTLRRRK